MMAAASHDTASVIWMFILEYWWLIWVAVMVGGSFLEGVRDFFIDAYLTIARARHRHRMAEIKARAKAEKKLTAAAVVTEPPLAPGPCQHFNVTPVVDTVIIDGFEDDKVVAWLCKNEECSAQLPVNWAVRKKDLQ
jgi:hypothetical protein